MKKVTEQELADVKNLQEKLLQIITITGELNLSKFVLETQLTEIQEQIKTQQENFLNFQSQERVLFEELQKKYGAGNINLETGEVTE